MNKTININLGGMFFHIDETAYQKLNRYLNSIRKSLSDDPQGKDEIIKDIEARISELLSDRIVDERQVVSDSDIDEIVEIMGQPEDYSVDEELFNDTQTSYQKRSSRPVKKLYRDGSDKFLGGVASGTAHYIGIEPIWSRIIWLVIAFGTGLGFIAYILLWILVPEAKTTAEKLEMEGERVNIDNIEKKIREEFQHVSNRVKEGADEVSGKIKDGANEISEKISSADYKKYKTKAKSGLQEFLDTLGSIIMTLLKVFAKFIGALIIFIAAITLVSLFIGLFSWGSVEALGIPNNSWNITPYMVNSALPYWLIALFVFVAVAIPFIVLFMLGLKILSNNSKSFGKVTGLTLLALWIISVLVLIFSAIDISSRFNHKEVYSEKHELAISEIDTLRITMVANEQFAGEYNYRYDTYGRRVKTVTVDDTKKLFSTRVNVDIRNSDTDEAYVKIRKTALGRNYEDAMENATMIEYEFKLSDTNLELNNYFFNKTLYSGFFTDGIDVIIYLPEGYSVFLDKTTRNFLDDVANVQNIYDRSMVNHHYIMTDTELDCLDCDAKYYRSKNEDEDENLNLKIDEDRVNLKIKSEDGDAEINIDEDGVTIK